LQTIAKVRIIESIREKNVSTDDAASSNANPQSTDESRIQDAAGSEFMKLESGGKETFILQNSEAVMLRDAPARCDRGTNGWRKRFIFEMLRGCTRIAFAIALLACGLQVLWASTGAAPPRRVTVHRSTQVVPRRFSIYPNGATVAVNQTRRFGVTDSEGRTVAVHWNVSGLGCSGLACGSIDDQGVYRTPSSLPQPRVVTLEAVLVSDSNYSVLTQVRLEGAAAVTERRASARVPIEAMEHFAGPMFGRQSAVSQGLLPMPNVVTPAPAVGRQTVARSSPLPALPVAIAAAPVVESRTVSRIALLLPSPNVIIAAPGVGKQTVARGSPPPALPVTIAAVPFVELRTVPRNGLLLPLPKAVAAAPVAGRQIVARSSPLPPLPVAIAEGPTSGQISPGRTPQNTAPVVGRSVATGAALLPLPDEVAAAPAGTVVLAQYAPVVTYRDGQLTIDARNSTLAEVLKLVAQKTGATIDVPPGSGLDRIFEHAGPGPAEVVLARLLNGSPFDFIIVSSPQHPQQLAQVLLSLRSADADVPNPAPAPRALTSPPAWTPPEAPSIQILPPQYDSSLTPPKEPLSPEARGELMREKAREIRERAQQQYPPPPQQ
jgi:hypothetical protein